MSGAGTKVAAVTMWDPDGSGPLAARLVAGGSFTVAGTTLATRIVTWNPLVGTWAAVRSPDDVASRLRRDVPAHPGKTYRNATGFSMWYPARWTPTEHAEAVQLAPPDPATTADGPTEIYVVSGESVADSGITDASDARVVPTWTSRCRRARRS